MADWSAIETALEDWVEDVTGLPTRWRGRPQKPTFSNQGYALLSISAIVTRGVDEVFSWYDDTQPAGSEIRSVQRGQRTFTFGVQIRTQRQTVDYDAKHYSSLIHDSLRLPMKTVAALALADIAIARVLADTQTPAEIEGREMSVSQVDIRMNARSVLEDTAVGYIENLKDLEIKDGDGNILYSGDISLA